MASPRIESRKDGVYIPPEAIVMEARKFRILISITLFMGFALTTSAYAGMVNGGDGGMKRAPGKVTFESMHRISTGTMTDGGVKMELEPASFENGIFRVKFYANTHKVNLGQYNMIELMHLEYADVGYRPVSMDRMRGHHAGGEIEFRVPEVPDHFRIVVRGLPDLEERIFEW
jgi:hypothetical protein